MIAASLREMARMAGAARARGDRAVEGVTARPYCVRAQRPIKPGEPHAVLASAGDGQADHRRMLTTAPRAISGYRWHSARHSRLAADPRPHRVRRLLARHCTIARAGLMMVARPRPAPHDNKSALLLEQSVVRGAPPGRATATRTEAPGNRLRPQANLPRYAPDDVPSLRP